MINHYTIKKFYQINEIVLFTEADSVPKSLDEEEIVGIVNNQKSALSNHVSKDVSNTNSHMTPDKMVDDINDFRIEDKSKETEEDMNLYNRVNQNCSSRLPEIK
ncbi:unnamed protein product [Rhizophagus irregularis]|nr:unnamed protein product [Rhizophagus irregularis]